MKILLTFLLSLLGLISTAQFSYVDLTIGFDQYPQETAWAITQGPDTILSDDDYGYTNYVSTTITERLLMEASPFPYKFTMTDEFGDGICCEYGSGFFSAENQCQGILFEDYDFGSEMVEYEFNLAPCDLPTVDVTFQLDLNDAPPEIINPEVNGIFNGWCGNCAPMEDPDGNGVWDITIPLSAGTYSWKFSANNWEYQEAPDGVNESGCFIFDEFGFINRQLTVGDEDIVLPPFCWESCLPCGAVPGCTDPEAYNWNPWANFDLGFCDLPIEIECEEGESAIIVTIVPDSYPAETGWELYDQTNAETIYEVLPGEYNTPGIPVQSAVCASVGSTLQFEITDTYGDGLNAAQFGGVDGTAVVGSCDSIYYFTNPMNVDFGYEDEIFFEVLACAGDVDIEGCVDSDYVEYSPDATIDDGSCSTLVVEGCMDDTQYNYSPEANVEEMLIACDFTLTITDGVGDGWFGSWLGVYQEGWLSPQYEMNPDDGFEKSYSIPLNAIDEAKVYFFANSQSINTIQQCGFKITNPEGEVVIDVPQFFVNAFPFVYEFQPYCGNTCIPFAYGCMDESASNYVATANTDDGSCYYAPGCMSAGYLEYYTQGFEADYDDGSCQTLAAFGCTDSLAFNYDAEANVDNGGCIAVDLGCTNPLAYNYDPFANVDDGGCIPFIYGCTDSTMFNYDPEANTDDGECEPFVYGCMDSTMFNFNPLANAQDNCIPFIYGCTDSSMFNYDPSANTEDFSCIPYIYGCTDMAALNYDSMANTDNGSCIEVVEGCMDQSAWNYDITANVDVPASCLYSADCITGAGNPYWLNDPCYAWVIEVDPYCCETDWDNTCVTLYQYCGDNYVGMENQSYLHLSIYPNPTTDILNVKSSLPTISSIYDLTGKLIIDQSLSDRLDMSAYPSGVYTIQVKVGERIHCERIIKQ
tara:strand:- start:12114 stop:14882 length:2769 start_codon:yes stop_codon:yes gene_type:complete